MYSWRPGFCAYAPLTVDGTAITIRHQGEGDVCSACGQTTISVEIVACVAMGV